MESFDTLLHFYSAPQGPISCTGEVAGGEQGSAALCAPPGGLARFTAPASHVLRFEVCRPPRSVFSVFHLFSFRCADPPTSLVPAVRPAGPLDSDWCAAFDLKATPQFAACGAANHQCQPLVCTVFLVFRLHLRQVTEVCNSAPCNSALK